MKTLADVRPGDDVLLFEAWRRHGALPWTVKVEKIGRANIYLAGNYGAGFDRVTGHTKERSGGSWICTHDEYKFRQRVEGAVSELRDRGIELSCSARFTPEQKIALRDAVVAILEAAKP